jgi:hypothetical protein
MGTPFADRVGGVSRRDGRLWLEAPGRDEPVAVTVRWLRPLTARREIVFLDGDQKEVLTAVGVAAVEGEGRALVEEALRDRYYLTRITRVNRIDVQFGTRYWEVETERGPRWFALREPGKNVLWLGSDHLIVRDTAGNRFEIADLSSLDGRSRRFVGLAL